MREIWPPYSAEISFANNKDFHLNFMLDYHSKPIESKNLGDADITQLIQLI